MEDDPIYELVEATLTGKVHVRAQGADETLCHRPNHGPRSDMVLVEELMRPDIPGHYGPHVCRACEKKLLALAED